MTLLRWSYLVLAIVGTIVPLSILPGWIAANDLEPTGLLAAATATPAATALLWELLLANLSLSLWALSETWVRKNWSALWAIPATLLIGISCGLPLFLFLRTRPID